MWSRVRAPLKLRYFRCTWSLDQLEQNSRFWTWLDCYRSTISRTHNALRKCFKYNKAKNVNQMEFCNRKKIKARSIHQITKIILHRIISVVDRTSFSPETWTRTGHDEESRRLRLSVKRSSNRRVHLVSRFTILRIVLLIPQLAEETVVFWVAIVFL